MKDPFDCLYDHGADDVIESLGRYFKAPECYSRDGTLIAKVPKRGRDGQSVEVYCTAMPVRFYTIKALPGKNSVGDHLPGFEFGTGSGQDMGELAGRMAIAISEGMLGFHPEETA